jgi:L-seryl-tRNA(Ser) seleniumtransferase
MNRRDIFRGAGTGFAAGLLSHLPLQAAARTTSGIYERIGVKPLINCKGTYTIISGSQSLPEVKTAMDEASRHYVHLDELMDAVGRRLAEVTKAEWGIVTAGCAAALTHATAACLAGADPEKMQRLPDLHGLKTEVVMPRPSRNTYDHAIRMLGVRMVTPNTREEFLNALRPSTAMVSLLGETIPRHPIPLEEMCAAAHRMGIPVLVDAAAERLTIPNVYLSKGVDMVAYSGGKCLRGPQCAGVLLGRKDLLQAAWLNSAPHHAFGRSLKVGKEEIMGMLAAVEAWVRRDHDQEWKQWENWLATIREKVATVPTVRTEILLPQGPSNYSPQLRVFWQASKIGLTGQELSDHLLSSDPRIIIPATDEVNAQGETHITIMPYMMMPGDDRVVASRLRDVLANPPRIERPEPDGEGQVTGQWDVEVEFVRGSGTHFLFLEQKGDRLTGHHRGETLAGDVRGSMRGNRARFRSAHRYEGTTLTYVFDGVVAGNTLSGTVDLGEYGKANFTARRRWA